MDERKRPYVRMRTSSKDKKKALDHYQELRRSGRVSRAVVIVEDPENNITILGQMLTPDEVKRLIDTAQFGVSHILEKQREIRREDLDPFISDRGRAGPARKVQEITVSQDGTLVPPPGEHFIGCGECNHSRFYVLMRDDDDQPARYSCSHCGNELKMIRSYHESGSA